MAMNSKTKLYAMMDSLPIVLLIGAFLLFLSPLSTNAQAWARDKGTGFYKIDFSSIQAANVFDTRGEIVPFRTLGNYITSFYGEYGVTNKLTVVGYVPFFVRNVVNATQARQTGTIIQPAIVDNSFGDIDFGLRYALPFKTVAVSANLTFGIPTGDAEQADGLFSGDGEFNQMLRIAIGTGKRLWWTQGALGFNNRTKGFSDEFRYDFEFGYKLLNDRLLAMLKINGIESLNNGTAQAAATGLFSNNVEFLGIGPEILYYANEKKTVGVSVRIAGAAKGRNVLAAPSISVGAFADL